MFELICSLLFGSEIKMKYELLGNNKQADLNLYVCEYDNDIEPGTRYGPVIRDSYIIEYCTKGGGSIIINGTEFSQSTGQCMILMPGDTVTHITGDESTRSGIWCAVKGIRISSYLSAVGISSENPYAPAQAADKIFEIMNKLAQMKSEHDAGADIRRTGYLHSIFGEILRYAKADTDKSAYIHRAVHIIETRYAEQLTVAGLARDIGLERSYFSTLFHKITGKSPQNYLSDIRIKKACALLSVDEYTINEAATAVGIAPEGFRGYSKAKWRYPRTIPEKLKACSARSFR